jgi:hypothetical protein
MSERVNRNIELHSAERYPDHEPNRAGVYNYAAGVVFGAQKEPERQAGWQSMAERLRAAHPRP